MMFCRDICNHFLAVTRSRKVLRRFSKWNFANPEDYKRCGYCDIQLKGYNQCPCCGHRRLTKSTYRYRNRSQYFKDRVEKLGY